MTNTASGSWGVPLVAAVVVLGILLCPSGKAMGMNYCRDGFESAKSLIQNGWVRFFGLAVPWGNLYGPATIRDRSDLYMHGVEMPVVDQVAVRIPVWRGRG